MLVMLELIREAKVIRENAYVPYSNFKVGAALRTKTGKIYTGCNIENSSYPVTCCAERVAIFSAIAQGEQDFLDMAVIADTEGPVSPCGSCRQVMSEFFDESMKIYLTNLEQDIKIIKMNEVLPFSFNADVLRSSDHTI